MVAFAAVIGLLLLAGLIVFQLFLIAGKPWGEFAWGGQHKVLPKKLRYSSVISIITYVIFGLFLATKAGFTDVISKHTVLNIGMWVFTIYLAFGILLNGISRSKKERALMTPVAALLAISFLIVTLS